MRKFVAESGVARVLSLACLYGVVNCGGSLRVCARTLVSVRVRRDGLGGVRVVVSVEASVVRVESPLGHGAVVACCACHTFESSSLLYIRPYYHTVCKRYVL